MSLTCANCVQCRLIDGTVKDDEVLAGLHHQGKGQGLCWQSLFSSATSSSGYACSLAAPSESLNFFGCRVVARGTNHFFFCTKAKGTLRRGETIRLSHEPRHPTPIEEGLSWAAPTYYYCYDFKMEDICIERMNMCCQKFCGEIGHKLLERKKNEKNEAPPSKKKRNSKMKKRRDK